MSSSCLQLPVSRQDQEIKETSVLHIFFKYQVSFFDLYSCCSCYVFRQQYSLFFWGGGGVEGERMKCSTIFYCCTKTTQLHPQSFSVASQVASPFFWQLCCTVDVIFHILLATSMKFCQCQLVMKNHLWNLSQSEAAKYF